MRSGTDLHNQELVRLRSRLIDLLDAAVLEDEPLARPARWSPAADIRRDGEDVVVEIEVAGVPREAIEVTLEGHVLTISGTRPQDEPQQASRVLVAERPSGEFARAFSFSFEPETVSAKLTDGLLRVTLSRQ